MSRRYQYFDGLAIVPTVLNVAPFVVRLWYIPGRNQSGSGDMDESRGGSRIVYPKLLATLAEADLVSQFRLAPEERAWAGTVARRGPSMVVLLTRLKVFQSIGHFLPLAQIPAAALSYCEATFTGGAHGRFNRPAHDLSAKQCHSHLLKRYAVGCKRPRLRFECRCCGGRDAARSSGSGERCDRRTYS
jgi:hypothetical protein